MDDTRVEQAKFETGGAPPSIDEGELPWTYGDDRITAMARDPESAYVYWEITDEGIASARSRLGAAGAHGWCNLRVYDTTGRDFDGVNAHDYFDIGIDRRDREYFLMIRRPGSSLHVEVGIMTHEGYFQPIARSGRVDFPRSGPSPNTQLDWMTVTSEGGPPCIAPYRSRYGGPEPQLPGREGAGYVDVWHAAYAPSPEIAPPPAVIDHPSGSAHHVVTHHAHIERWWSLDEWRAEWRAGLRFLHWEHHDPRARRRRAARRDACPREARGRRDGGLRTLAIDHPHARHAARATRARHLVHALGARVHADDRDLAPGHRPARRVQLGARAPRHRRFRGPGSASAAARARS